MISPQNSIAIFNTGFTRDGLMDSLKNANLFADDGIENRGLLLLSQRDAFILSLFEIDGILFLEIDFTTEAMRSGKKPIPQRSMTIQELRIKMRKLSLNPSDQKAVWAIHTKIYKGIANDALLNSKLLTLN